MDEAPREIEIKLVLDLDRVPNLRAHLIARAGGDGETRRLASVYFDTRKLTLRNHGLTLRVRRVGDRHIQTVKAGEGGAGLFDRAEWECDVPDGTPDLGALADTPVARLLRGRRRPPHAVFTTTVERTTWTVADGASVIEVALDVAEVAAPGALRAFAEVELELKSGRAEALFPLVHALGDVAGLRVGVVAKSDRGYALVRGEAPKSYKAPPVALVPGMPSGAAVQAILRGCIRQWRLNEDLIVESRAAEALHQGRVALRRLRSALSLFEEVVDDDALDDLKARLRDLATMLGDARNLDVYRARMVAAETTPAPALLDAIDARRAEIYRQVVATLEAAPARRLIIDTVAWIETGAWLSDPAPGRAALRARPIEKTAAAILDRRRRQVKRKGRQLDAIDPHARHRVRIAAKKLRYAADFFADLAARKKERGQQAAFVETLEALQTVLGDLNDIETGHHVALTLAGTEAAALPLATPHAPVLAIETLEPKAEPVPDLLKMAVKAHAAFCDATPFWTRWR